jgi:Protein of unknown function (DUF3551)
MFRRFSFAMLVAASALGGAASIAPAAAEPIQDTYCLQGRSSGYPGNCEFSSFAQCMATASGTNDGCGINPMRAYARPHHMGYRAIR